MRFSHFLIVLGITGFFHEARADILTIRQDVVAPGTGDRVEVTTFLTENDDDRLEVIERLRKSLAEDAAKNPALLTGFEEIVDAKGRSPNAESDSSDAIGKIAGARPVRKQILSPEIRRALEIRYPDWFVKNSRMIFTVSRGVINATVSTWSLMIAQHLPFPVAVAAGVLAGGMSGGLQYFNEEFQKFLTKSVAEKLAKGKLLGRGAAFVEPYFRWYLLEVGFITAIEIALTAMGHPPAGTLTHNIGNTLTTALSTLAAQGTWEVAVSRATRRGQALAKTAVAQRMVRFRADFITLGLSALSVTGMVGKLSGYSFGSTIFWGMGITGGVYLVKVLYSEWKCRRLLSRPEDLSKSDPVSSPPAGADDDSPTASLDPRFYFRARFIAS